MPSSARSDWFIWIACAILVIVFAGYIRLVDISAMRAIEDEAIVMVAAAKLHIAHPSYDPRYYNFEHPFLGKWILGGSIDAERDHSNTALIPINVYAYTYLAAPELREEQVGIRLMAVFFGILFIAGLMLLGWVLFDDVWTALLGAAFGTVSIGFINLSRLAFQDALLPFFMTLCVAGAYGYVRFPLEKKWNGLPLAYAWLGMCLLFLELCLLTRTGQPYFLLAGLVIGIFACNGRKWPEMVAGGAFVVLLAIGLMSQQVFNAQANQKYLDSPLLQLNVGWLFGFFSQNSFSVLLACAFVIFLAWQHRKRIILLARERMHFFSGVASVHRMSAILMLVFLTGIAFTPLGQIPRYYLVFFFIPLAYLARTIVRFAPRFIKFAIMLMLLLDASLLVGASSSLTGYSPLGPSPIFSVDARADVDPVLEHIDRLGLNHYFTNDSRLLLADARAIPLPPKHLAYDLPVACTPDFMRSQRGSVIVYFPSFPLENNPYACAHIDVNSMQRLALPPSLRDTPFEWYRVKGSVDRVEQNKE